MAAIASEIGYDGLELACWGDHFEVDKAWPTTTTAVRIDLLVRQTAGRSPAIWSGRPSAINRPSASHTSGPDLGAWRCRGVEGAIEEMKDTARAAARLGVPVVNGFTGSSIWPDLYFFPPTPPDHVKRGYDDFANRWGPILDVFKDVGVKFALEVHPSEIAYDIYTAEAALDAVGHHEAFGFNFDPSHLVWQGVDPARFIDRFPDRIFVPHEGHKDSPGWRRSIWDRICSSAIRVVAGTSSVSVVAMWTSIRSSSPESCGPGAAFR